MSSAGHILDMIIRFRNNEALRKATRNRYTEMKESYLKHCFKHLGGFSDNKPTDIDLDRIKKKIRADIIRERKMVMIKSSITLLLVLMLITFLMYLLIQD
ncbi:MAG: hypothetical protein JXB00_11205 [Bacteroidales bacterium]|nr:hypothetical protein [Bacteroidales bacterium]